MINKTFLKSNCPGENKNQKHMCKISKTKFIQGKLKIRKFSLKAIVQKLCNLLPFIQGFPKILKS